MDNNSTNDKLKMNYKYSSNEGIINRNKEPNFFSHLFSSLIYIINWSFAGYLIFSFIIYSFHVFLGEDFMTGIASVSDNFTQNNFYGFITITVFILLGFLSEKYKSFRLLFLNIVVLFMINIEHFIIFYQYNKDSKIANIKSLTGMILDLIILLTNILISLYCIYYYFLSIGYLKFNLNDIPLSKIIHEIKLKTDIMKMDFNSFLIAAGVNKYMPGLLYKKEDYYFMNCVCSNEREYVYHCGNYLQEKNKEDITHDLNYLNNSNDSYNNLNSKSTVDISELEPLN